MLLASVMALCLLLLVLSALRWLVRGAFGAPIHVSCTHKIDAEQFAALGKKKE